MTAADSTSHEASLIGCANPPVEDSVIVSRVSVVIPCYNDDPEHLEASVRSAQDQTHGDVEVIVVDDGSTRRETLASLDALTDVTLVRRENGGTGSALNTGISRAHGTYIIPLGADDLIVPNFVETILRTIQNAPPNVVGVYPLVEFFGQSSGIAPMPSSVTLADLAVRNRVVATGIFSKTDWSRAGGYGEFDDCSEDWYFWAVLLGRTNGELIYDPDAHFMYRVRAGSRNKVNRGADRKRNGRRHIAAALPEKIDLLYFAAAEQADEALAEVQRYTAFVNGWKRRAGFLAPGYKYLHRLIIRSP